MTAACFVFAAMNAIVRLGSEELHVFQMVFFRNAFGMVLIIPILVQGWPQVLRTKQQPLYAARAVSSLAAMLLWFWSLSKLALADAVALSFTMPLFVTIGAALFLGEAVKLRRWSATLAGLLGALVILRPGQNPLIAESLLVILSAVFMATSAMLIKILVRTDRSSTIVSYMVLYLTPLSLVAAIPVWQWPSAQGWFLMVALGGCATAGQYLFTTAVRDADVSAIMPFDFFRLPFSALLGFWLFDQMADVWTWVGAAIIFGAGIYIVHRESRLGVDVSR